MNLIGALEGREYTIKQINIDDNELKGFLFSLGCYEGEPITVVAHRKSGCIVAIKNSRYSIDNALAKAISVFKE